ncbi:MAG: VWA domain-containing protein, partial [Planctomycetota bacterium]
VSGKLDVTYVAAAEGRELATALAAADSLAVRRTAPADLSTADRALLATDVVVLDNVPADRLGGGRMAWLQSFVADAGGGLLVLGGPDAYGAGGYAGTPLAGLLPVDPDPERRAARPTSVAVVADRSSSMAEQVGGREKIEYVREAVLRARAEFGARSGDRADEMSVISFNERPEVLIERQRVGTPAGARALRAALVSLFPQGKTRIARALGAGQTLLARSDLRRHVVLVSDGRSQDELVARRLIAELRAKEVVLSVLGTADEMNAGLAELKAAAEGTQGRFVLLDSISELPAAMARETRTIAGSLVRLGEFAVDRGPGAWPGDVPAPETVRGYVLTGARPEAPPLLVAGQAPILAAWPRGLGRVVACTTSPDAWAPDWARAAPGFFEALVLWAGGRGRRPVVDVRLGQSDGKIRIVARAATDLGEAEPIAVVRRPGGERSDVPLRQTGRRRYEAEIDGAAEGTYVATVRGRDAGTPLGEGHLTVDVAEEWRPGGETGAGLRLARATGGVAVDDLSELPAPTRAGSATRSTRRFVSVLLGLAALAFLVAVLR